MPTFQTSPQNSQGYVFGSCLLEISLDNGNNWTNVGVSRAVNFNETVNVVDIQADNSVDLLSYVSDQFVEITFNGLEWFMPTLNKIRGGIDTYSQTSTGSTTATDSYSTGGSSADKFIALQNQGTGTTGITITSVKQVDTGGTTTTLTVDDDYVRMQSNDAVGVVMRNDGGSSYNSTESLVVAYSYDKVASENLSSGGLTDISSRWFRLTNKKIVSGETKYRYITLYSASLNAGMNLAFKSDSDDDPIMENPISIKAEVDTSRTAGDQLYAIEDQVGITS